MPLFLVVGRLGQQVTEHGSGARSARSDRRVSYPHDAHAERVQIQRRSVGMDHRRARIGAQGRGMSYAIHIDPSFASTNLSQFLNERPLRLASQA